MSAQLDLKQTSGLDLKLDISRCHLIFAEDLTAPQPAIRTIKEMRDVLWDSGVGEPEELYYMYRDVHRVSDGPLLKKYNLRYDVTVIRPERLGRELMKTAGHYHPGSFPELYEVLAGKAFCMLQKHNKDDYLIIEDVIAVEAIAGQKIVIPPGYGHILVNPGPGCLVTSNWVSSCFASEYDLYKKAKGAAYFLATKDAPGHPDFIKNPSFARVAAIKFAKPAKRFAAFALKENSPMYEIIHHDPDKLGFLNNPEQHDYSGIFIFN